MGCGGGKVKFIIQKKKKKTESLGVGIYLELYKGHTLREFLTDSPDFLTN